VNALNAMVLTGPAVGRKVVRAEKPNWSGTMPLSAAAAGARWHYFDCYPTASNPPSTRNGHQCGTVCQARGPAAWDTVNYRYRFIKINGAPSQ